MQFVLLQELAGLPLREFSAVKDFSAALGQSVDEPTNSQMGKGVSYSTDWFAFC